MIWGEPGRTSGDDPGNRLIAFSSKAGNRRDHRKLPSWKCSRWAFRALFTSETGLGSIPISAAAAWYTVRVSARTRVIYRPILDTVVMCAAGNCNCWVTPKERII